MTRTTPIEFSSWFPHFLLTDAQIIFPYRSRQLPSPIFQIQYSLTPYLMQHGLSHHLWRHVSNPWGRVVLEKLRGNSSSASQEKPRLWNPKVHYRVHKCLPPVQVLSQVNSVQVPPPSHCLKIHLNIILPPMPGSFKLSLSFTFPKPCTYPSSPHKCYMTRRSHSPLFPHPINPSKPELNPICYLLALLGAHHFLHVGRIRVKLLTFRRLMSYIYGAPILDVSRSHTTTQHSR